MAKTTIYGLTVQALATFHVTSPETSRPGFGAKVNVGTLGSHQTARLYVVVG